MAANSNCSLCKCALMDPSDSQSCMCSYLFCKYCISKHKNDMNKFYSPLTDEQYKCQKHAEKYSQFCHEINCKQVVCQGCRLDDHFCHKTYDLAVRSQHIPEEMSNLKKRCDDKFEEVNRLISRIDDAKDIFKREVEDLQTSIYKNRDDLFQFVKETFQNQIHNLLRIRIEELEKFKEEQNNLARLQADIRKISQLYFHFPINESYLQKTISYYPNYEAEAKLALEKCHNSFDFKKLDVIRRSSCMQMQRIIKEFAGELKLVNEKIYLTHSREVLVTDCVFDSVSDAVRDICYDVDSGYLFILIYKFKRSFIRIISQKSVINEFQVDVRSGAKSIIPLGSHSLLLLYETKLKVIPLDLRKVSSLPEEILGLNNIVTVCSSPCQKFAYIFCKDGNVFRYNPSNNRYDSRMMNLVENDSTFINVDESLDYILLTGHGKGAIHVYSYDTGRPAFVLGNPFYVYTSTVILPGNILVAFRDRGGYCLETFNFPEKDVCRQVTAFNYEGKLQNFGPVYVMVRDTSNTILIGEKFRVYRISL